MTIINLIKKHLFIQSMFYVPRVPLTLFFGLQDLCKDVNFDISEKGIEVQCMDSSHVALVSLLLRECAFSEFKCDRAVSLGMNIDSLTKILKMTGDTPKMIGSFF